MEIKSTFSSSPPPTLTTSVTTRRRPQHFRLQTTARHRKHHLTRAHTPLLSHLNRRLGPAMYAIKIKNCNIMKMHAVVFQTSFPHKLSLPAQLVFLFRKVTFIILKSMSLFGVVQPFFVLFCCFLLQTAHTNRVLNVPLAF